MRCSSFAVSQILVGLYRVGIVGLHDALKDAERSGLVARDDYDLALWREYLRHRGADFRDFFSQVQVTVRGEPSEERDRLVAMATSILAEFELKPEFRFEPCKSGETGVRLLIGDHEIVRGCPTADRFKLAVRKSLSDW
jgi:hypothetical protein